MNTPAGSPAVSGQQEYTMKRDTEHTETVLTADAEGAWPAWRRAALAIMGDSAMVPSALPAAYPGSPGAAMDACAAADDAACAASRGTLPQAVEVTSDRNEITLTYGGGRTCARLVLPFRAARGKATVSVGVFVDRVSGEFDTGGDDSLRASVDARVRAAGGDPVVISGRLLGQVEHMIRLGQSEAR